MEEFARRTGSFLKLTPVDKEKLFHKLLVFSEAESIRTWYDKEGKLVGVLVFDVKEDLWSDVTYIQEIFTLTIDHSYAGLQSLVLKELDRLALWFNADFILVDTGKVHPDREKLIVNGYTKRGYHKTFETLIKKVNRYDYA